MAIYRRTQDYESNKALLILSIIVMAAGILILLSTFMTWTSGQTGWSLKGSFNQGDRSYTNNPFYSYGGGGYLFFSGLCSLILGALTALAGKQQMILITHWPQLARLAKRHFLVRKDVVDGLTFTGCVRLDVPEIEAELVRMSGGGSA